MKKSIVIFLFFLAISLYAQENTNQNYNLSGSVRLDHFSYSENFENKINSRNQALLQLKFEAPYQKKHTFSSSLHVREDISDPSRNRVYLEQMYMTFKFENADLRVGKQIINWGKADAINPTNNLNAIDYTDVFDTEDETIGLMALNASYFVENWKLQGVFSSIFQKSIFAEKPESRWYINPFELIANDLGIQNYKPTYIPLKEPETDLRSSQLGLYIGNSINGFDFSFSYYNGFSHIPNAKTLDITPVGPDTMSIAMENSYNRQQVLGCDFATTIGKLGLRGEGAYFIPKDILIPNPYFRYVVGLDRNISNVIGQNNLFIIMQWIQEINEKGIHYSTFDMNHLFKKSLMIRLQSDIAAIGNISIQALYNVDNRDYYIRPQVEFTVVDDVNFLVMADLFEGNKDAFFGIFDSNDRVLFKLKYSF